MPGPRSERKTTEIADKITATLVKLVADDGSDAAVRPALIRQLSRLVVDLRERYTYEGRPDWIGRSNGYRDRIHDCYVAAKVPNDQSDAIQASCRYHVGNAIRFSAPPEALQALGLDPEGPLGRTRRSRAATRAARPPRPPLDRPTDLLGLLDLAFGALSEAADLRVYRSDRPAIQDRLTRIQLLTAQLLLP